MKKLILLLLPFLIIACQKKDEPKAEQETSIQKVEVENSWMSPSVEGANSAMFFNIVNDTDSPDTLFGAESNIDEVTMIHETFTNPDGTIGMRHVEFIAVPPHSNVEFKPGGRHIMMMNLHSDLSEGDTANVTLKFRRAGDVNLNVPVKDLF